MTHNKHSKYKKNLAVLGIYSAIGLSLFSGSVMNASAELVAPSAGADQRKAPTIFDSVPTISDLEKDLLNPKNPHAKKARAIVFDTEEEHAPSAQPIAPASSKKEEKAAVVAPTEAKAKAVTPVNTPDTTKKPATVVVSAPSGSVVGMPIQFDDTKQVSAKSKLYVEKMSELMKKYPSWNFQIEGHTEEFKDEKTSLDLSQDYADKIRKLLIEQYGIEESRLISVGKGSSEPLKNTPPENTKNRRVQFVVL